MNPFLDKIQIEETDPFYDEWDNETKYEVEDYYDDLSFGLPLESSYDF